MSETSKDRKKERQEFLKFSLYTKEKLAPHPGSHDFQQIKNNSTYLCWRVTPGTVETNYFQIGPVIFNKKIIIIKFFLLVIMATRILHGIDIFEQLTLKGDHLKFGEIPPSALGGDHLKEIVGRHRRDDRHLMITINNSSH